MKIGFPYIVIALLIAIIVWLTKCNDSTKCNNTAITKIDTQTIIKHSWDTFTKKETIFKPKWDTIYITDTIHDSVLIYRVLPLILTKDSMVIKNDSVNIKVVYEIISENPLYKINKKLDYKIKYKEIEKIITKEVVRKHALFAGPSIGLHKNTGYISFDGLYERNGKIIYNLGAGLNKNLEPIFKVGVYWQILK
jgi:hypothetical protein